MPPFSGPPSQVYVSGRITAISDDGMSVLVQLAGPCPKAMGDEVALFDTASTLTAVNIGQFVSIAGSTKILGMINRLTLNHRVGQLSTIDLELYVAAALW